MIAKPPIKIRQLSKSPPNYALVLRRFILAGLLLILVIFVGTTGYFIIEGWRFMDSLYMTVITIATVGYREVHILSETGRVFTIFLIISGIGIGGYAIGNIVAFITEGQLLNMLRGRKMVKEITNLKNHIIVCGYGKIGRSICSYLSEVNEPFIVLDKDEDKMDEALALGYLAAVGDASEDDILIKGGIKNAKGLISAISDDSANVYLVLSARTLNENITIIARGTDESSRKKLLRVGASAVVSPFEIGARRMVSHLVQPHIIEFVDMFQIGHDYGLEIEKLKIQKSSDLVGKRLDESYIKWYTNGGLVIGIEKDSQMIINPPGYTVLEADDIILALGNDEQMRLLHKIVK